MGNFWSFDWLNPLNWVTNIAGGISDIVQGERNYNLQKENLAYQKNLQQQIFAREDSSIQRRVADLQKAGLSPTLAAGSGAGTGQAISTEAPQRKYSAQEKAFMIQQGLKQQADISRTKAEENAIRMQADKTAVEIDLLKEQRGKYTKEKDFLDLQYAGLQDEISHRGIGRDLQLAQADSTRAGISRMTAEQEKIYKELEIMAHNMGVADRHGLPYGQSLGNSIWSLGSTQSVRRLGERAMDIGWKISFGEDVVNDLKDVWNDLKEHGVFGFSKALADSAWNRISSTISKGYDKIKAAPGNFLESFNKLIEKGKGQWSGFYDELKKWQSQWQ